MSSPRKPLSTLARLGAAAVTTAVLGTLIAVAGPTAAFADPKDVYEIPGGPGNPISNGCPAPTPPATTPGQAEEAAGWKPNTQPIVWGDAFTVVQNHPRTIKVTDFLCNDKDAEYDTVYLHQINMPVHGSATNLSTLAGTSPTRSFSYVPDKNFTGTDALMYDIVDEHGAVAPYKAAIVITVVPQKAPVSAADNYTTTVGSTMVVPVAKGLIANDSDAEKDTMNSSSMPLFGPAHGTVTMAPEHTGGFTYKADPSYVGTDTFYYRVTDNHGGLSKLSLVTITVTPKALTAAPTPTITGTAAVGQTVTAHAGTWGPAPVALSYQWKRGGAPIAGATAATYAVAESDAGQTLSVAVTGAKTNYTSATKVSAATAMVAGGTMTPATPKISGTPTVGEKLTATVTGWAPSSATFTYQWKRNGAVITGSTSAVRLLTANDAGAKLTVTVTATKPGFISLSATSAATATVTTPLPPVPNAVPTKPSDGEGAAAVPPAAVPPTTAPPAAVPTKTPAPSAKPAPAATPAPAPTATPTPTGGPAPVTVPTAPRATPPSAPAPSTAAPSAPAPSTPGSSATPNRTPAAPTE